MTTNDKTVYLNGEFIPVAQAKISVLDRGFLFADGIYEVIPLYNGKLFRLAEHIRRLHNSLQALDIPAPCDDAHLASVFTELYQRNAQLGNNQVIYAQVTRGADVKRHHNIPDHLEPTFFAQSSPLPQHDFEALQKGKRALVTQDIRWDRCDIKSISLLANVLLNHQAKNAKCEEAILLRDGQLSEGASSNVFIVENGTLLTPPLCEFILGGITRDMIIELAKQHNIPLVERSISEAQLFAADEVWICSSTRTIFPIVTLNDRQVGDGQAGPMWRIMIEHFQRYVSTL